MEELWNLAEACGMQVAGQITQNMERPHSALYMGKGKLSEVKEFLEQHPVDVVIFDRAAVAVPASQSGTGSGLCDSGPDQSDSGNLCRPGENQGGKAASGVRETSVYSAETDRHAQSIEPSGRRKRCF